MAYPPAACFSHAAMTMPHAAFGLVLIIDYVNVPLMMCVVALLLRINSIAAHVQTPVVGMTG